MPPRLRAARSACIGGFAGFLTAWLVGPGAAAQTQADRDPQTIELVRAIAVEARERSARGMPVTQAWRTLDRDKLARLLVRPELAAGAGRDEINLLIDQAGAWDLLHFDKPSDVLAAWQRWRPDDEDLKPLPPTTGRVTLTSPSFYADAPYSDEAGAFMALWRCLAPPAWRVWHTNPMVWALENGSGWDRPNTFDFGVCVQQQSETGRPAWNGEPASSRGRRSAAVLEQKLSATLRRQGCQGRGPDDCLVLLHALVSLAPRHEGLPQLLDELAAHFRQPRPPALLQGLGKPGAAYGSADWDAAQRARRELVRQALFIEVRLKLQRNALQAPVSAARAEETLQQLFELSDALARLDRLQGTAFPQPRFRSEGRIGNPWGSVEQLAATDAVWSRALLALGGRAAAVPGCAISERFSRPDNKLPGGFWLGFVVDKLTREQHSCGELARTGLAESYGKAGATTSALEPLQPLRQLLGDESRARGHNELVTALGAGCPLASDPWGVCNWIEGPSLRMGEGSGLRRLPLRAADRFGTRPLFPAAGDPPPPDLQLARLLARARQLRPGSFDQVSARLAELGRWGMVTATGVWSHPRHRLVAAELELQPQATAATAAGEPPADLPAVARTGRLLLVFGDTQARLISLRGGWGQYDDGRLAAISDIDGDLRLEVWFSGTHGECDGEGARPGVDCALTRYHFGGEVFGSELSPYRRGPAVEPRR